MSIDTQKLFQEALTDVDQQMINMGFIKKTSEVKGYAIFVKFSKLNFNVEFACSPPEYHVEMFIEVMVGNISNTYDLSDLLENQSIMSWVEKNKLILLDSENYLRAEVRWFVSLLPVVMREFREAKG